MLATDGVWEFLDADKVMAIVDRHVKAGRPLGDACRFIIALSANEWIQHEGDYRDDITVMVISLRALTNQGLPTILPTPNHPPSTEG